jgi:hypothetical protein
MLSAACTLPDSDDPAVRLVAGVGSPHPALSTTLYAAAVIELCARVWLELERLAELCQHGGNSDAVAFLALRAATLRLELLVLSDACDSPLSRSRLSGEQRASLRSMLSDVLNAIAFEPDTLTRNSIGQAQDRLFDEVLAQYSTAALSTALAEFAPSDLPIDDDRRSNACRRSEPAEAI